MSIVACGPSSSPGPTETANEREWTPIIRGRVDVRAVGSLIYKPERMALGSHPLFSFAFISADSRLVFLRRGFGAEGAAPLPSVPPGLKFLL